VPSLTHIVPIGKLKDLDIDSSAKFTKSNQYVTDTYGQARKRQLSFAVFDPNTIADKATFPEPIILLSALMPFCLLASS